MPRYQAISVDGSFRFKCIRCDFCCGTGPNVSLTVFDVVRMARFLRLDPIEFLKRYVKVIVADLIPFFSLRDKGNGECVFMERKPDGETLCVIYPARPMRCRLYPVIVESVKPRRVYVDLMCPGVGQGPEVKVPKRLLEQYIEERRRHYQLLYRLVFEEGLEPVEAAERAVREAEREAKHGAKWADLDYIESLGGV